MTRKIALLFLLGLAASAVSLTTSCKKLCGDNLPQFTISAAERAWANPFVPTTTWRFTNAAGYVRTYRITKSESQNVGSGGATKTSICPTYYEEYQVADAIRTDSTDNRNFYRLTLAAPDGAGGTINGGGNDAMQWGDGSFYLTIKEVEAGQVVLSPMTLGGHTYNAVMDRTNTQFLPLVLHLFLTKAEGVVAFNDRRGVLWTRL